jgi:hypothetical protein
MLSFFVVLVSEDIMNGWTCCEDGDNQTTRNWAAEDAMPVHEVDGDKAGEDYGAELDEAEEEEELGWDPTVCRFCNHLEGVCPGFEQRKFKLGEKRWLDILEKVEIIEERGRWESVGLMCRNALVHCLNALRLEVSELSNHQVLYKRAEMM